MAQAELEILIKARDEATKTLGGINNQLQGMSKQLKIAGAAMIGTGGVIIGTLGMAAKAAADEQAGIVKLTQAMKNVGISYDEVRDSLEELIDTQQQKTAIADTDQREALSKLVLATGDLTEAQDLLTIAMDMSRGMGIDLSSAADRLGMALAGNWGMLQRYIPVLAQCQTEEEKWLKLREMFAGQAEAYGQTMAGQFELLKNNLGDLKEAVGGFVLEAAAPVIEKIQDFVRTLKDADPATIRTITQIALLSSGLLVLGGGLLLVLGFLPSLTAGFGILTGAITSTTVSILGLKLSLLEITVIIAGLTAIAATFLARIDAMTQGMSYQEAQTVSTIGWLQRQMNALLGLDKMYEDLATQQDKLRLKQQGIIAVCETATSKMYLYTEAEVEWAKAQGYAVTMVEEGTEAIEDQSVALEDYSEDIEQAQQALEEYQEQLDSSIQTQESFIDRLEQEADALIETREQVDALTESTIRYTEAVEKEFTSLQQLYKVGEGVTGAYGEMYYGGYAEWLWRTPQGRELIKADIAAAQAGVAGSQAAVAEMGAMGAYLSGMLGIGQLMTLLPQGYQRGGVIPETGLIYAHKGETVLPANARIELHSYIYLDGEQIAESVNKHISDEIALQGGF